MYKVDRPLDTMQNFRMTTLLSFKVYIASVLLNLEIILKNTFLSRIMSKKLLDLQ